MGTAVKYNVMRKYVALLSILAVGVAGCKKAAPTVFIKAMSLYMNDYDGQGYQHSFNILSASPNQKPTVSFNNRTVPDDRISSGFGDYFGWDTLPAVSPNTDVEMKVTYYNVNEEKKEASSRVKLPSEPSGMSLSVKGGEINLSWGKPDKKTTDFIYAGLNVQCVDNSYNSQYAAWDTVITDLENTTSLTKTLGSLCNEIGDVAYAFVYAALINMKGPWSGSKDNVKGAKGQYYGGAGKGDTTSYLPTKATVKAPSLPKVNWGERVLKATERYFGMPADEGEWIR